MASMGYPPFSAPATIERRKKVKERSWLRSAKEVFMKPWKRQSNNRRPQQPRRHDPRRNPLMNMGGNPYEQPPGFNFAQLKSRVEGDFPGSSNLHGDNVPLPFSGNRLSPDGGPGTSSKESGSEAEIKIPETAYGSRPPLTNIFQMSNNKGNNSNSVVNKSSSSASVTNKSSSSTSVTNKSSSSTSVTNKGSKTSIAKPQPPISQQNPKPSSHPLQSPVTTSPPRETTPTAAETILPAITAPQIITTPDPASPTHLPAITSAQYNQRRHSTPITSSLSAPATPRDHRRPSASSDISAEKLRNYRRDRRSSATREMPLLPKRGQDPFQCSSHSSTLSTPDHSATATPYSEFAGSYTSAQLQHQQMAVDPAQVALGMMASSVSPSSQRPPVSPGGQPGVQPPAMTAAAPVAPQQVMLSPHAELQDLQEELDDDDEPDGAENFLAMIEEMEEVEYPQLPPRNFNPIAQTRKPVFLHPKVKEEPSKPASGGGGLGFGVKKGLRLSNKKQEKQKKNVQQPVIPAHLQDPKDDDADNLKGFDGFFMY